VGPGPPGRRGNVRERERRMGKKGIGWDKERGTGREKKEGGDHCLVSD